MKCKYYYLFLLYLAIFPLFFCAFITKSLVLYSAKGFLHFLLITISWHKKRTPLFPRTFFSLLYLHHHLEHQYHQRHRHNRSKCSQHTDRTGISGIIVIYLTHLCNSWSNRRNYRHKYDQKDFFSFFIPSHKTTYLQDKQRNKRNHDQSHKRNKICFLIRQYFL